jgi:5-deoxy-glucuronate isomerase
VVDDARDGWVHTGLRVGSLADGEGRTLELGAWEGVVVPLTGALAVHCVDSSGREHEARLAGRASVFAGPTDVAYLPRGSRVTINGHGPARVAVALARAS